MGLVETGVGLICRRAADARRCCCGRWRLASGFSPDARGEESVEIFEALEEELRDDCDGEGFDVGGGGAGAGISATSRMRSR